MNRMTLLLGLIFVQFAVILGMWLCPVQERALAQIPDPAAQREAMIAQLTASNQKLDRIIDLLSGGKLQVQVAKDDDKNGQ